MTTIPAIIFASAATHAARIEKIFAGTRRFNVVETIADVDQLIESSGPTIPDLAVIDLSHPQAASGRLWATLHVLYANIRLACLVELPINKLALQAALHAGVKHFAHINEPKEQLLEVAQAAHQGAFQVAPPEVYEAMTSIFESMARNVLQIGSLKLDFNQRQVFVDRQIINLTPLEFNLLTYLARHANRTVSSDELLLEIWGYDRKTGCTKNQLNCCIKRLRKKLGANAPRIISMRGHGYSIATKE
jgi:DNA-binding winged helix-turn-helix (wHTH) protein